MAGFLAYILPVDTGLHPAHPIAPGGPPPQIWPSPGHPAHPIAPGGPPPTIWPGPGPLPHPEHPIAPGGPPPTIWPSPGHPAHPIYLPPGIWPNPPEGQAPLPEHPIVIPPPDTAPPGTPPLEVKVAWTPATGWVVVLVPTGPHPAPSK